MHKCWRAAALVMLAFSSFAAEDQAAQNVGQEVISASTLKRTHTVSPIWPAAATGIEGWVGLTFTLLPNGTVADIKVTEADPVGIFEDSAVTALQQWKYEPVERDGKKIAQRVEIRMKYALKR